METDHAAFEKPAGEGTATPGVSQPGTDGGRDRASTVGIGANHRGREVLVVARKGPDGGSDRDRSRVYGWSRSEG